jgi:hypothetical protein
MIVVSIHGLGTLKTQKWSKLLMTMPCRATHVKEIQFGFWCHRFVIPTERSNPPNKQNIDVQPLRFLILVTFTEDQCPLLICAGGYCLSTVV